MTGKIFGVICEGNRGDGIHLGPGSSVEITGAVSRNNGGNGITIDQAEVIMHGGLVGNNAGHGIYVTEQDRYLVEKAIAAKPISEQTRWRAFTDAVMSGSIAGVTVELLKAQLGIA